MGLNLMNIGLSGVLSSQKQLNVSGHNINNVNTPGYSRQIAEQKADDALWHGGNMYGTGSYIDNVKRSYDQFAAQELTLSTSNLHHSAASQSQLNMLDDFMSKNGSRVVSSMNDFYDAVKSLADNPNDLGGRKVVLEQANTVANNFNSIQSKLTGMHNDINDQLDTTVDRINAIGQELAAINRQVSEDPRGINNDVLDKQQQLINELAQYTNVTVLNNKNGASVLMGSGHTLVSGPEVTTLVMTDGSPDHARKELAIQHGNTIKPISNQDIGGSLSALMDYRDDVLAKSMDQVGRMAIGFSAQVNTIQRQGIDLNGQQGQNIYQDINDPAVQKSRVLAPAGSLADVSVAIGDVSQLKAGEYQLKADFDGTNYTYSLQDPQGNVMQSVPSTTQEQTLSFDGMEIAVTTAPANGETLVLRPVRDGARDMTTTMSQPEQFATQRYVEDGPQNTGYASLELMPTPPATVKGSYNVSLSPAGDSVSVQDADGNPVKLLDSSGASVGSLPYPLKDHTLTLDNGTGGPAATFRLSAGASGNDSFRIDVGAKPAEGDNSNLMAMQEVQTQKTMAGGRSSVIDLFESMSTDIGLEKMNAEKLTQINQVDFDAATERVANISGVNLDEEAANLMKFQQAYMASSRIISVAKETFDTLMRAV